MTAAEYDFDVAVSFAGEDRRYVQDVVRGLDATELRVFYDEDHQVEMWGEDLVEFFTELYEKRARYVLMFISRHYADKMWANLERRSALARAVTQRSAYILPIRLDDTSLPGLLPTLGYLDTRRIGLPSLIAAVQAKVSSAAGGTLGEPAFDGRVPRTAAAITALLTERPAAWEYLLFAAILEQGIPPLDGRLRDHDIGFARSRGPALTLAEAVDVISSAIAEVMAITDMFNRLLAPASQEAAFGAPGDPGDPDRITHLGERFTSIYEEFLDWADRLRSTSVANTYLRPALDVLARYVDQPLHTMRDFVTKYVLEADTFTERLAADEPIHLEMTIQLEVSDDLVAELEAVMAEATRQLQDEV